MHHALIGHLPRETVEEAVRDHGGREGFSHTDDRAGGFQDPHGIGFRVPPVREDGQPRALFVGGFVPGVRAVAAPADAAVVIPAGCDIVVQTHYVLTGKLETDSNLKKPMRFPAGTRFETECAYDNSTANPRNPFDPPQNVWHNETIDDEMLLPMFTFVSERPRTVLGRNRDVR